MLFSPTWVYCVGLVCSSLLIWRELQKEITWSVLPDPDLDTVLKEMIVLRTNRRFTICLKSVGSVSRCLDLLYFDMLLAVFIPNRTVMLLSEERTHVILFNRRSIDNEILSMLERNENETEPEVLNRILSRFIGGKQITPIKYKHVKFAWSDQPDPRPTSLDKFKSFRTVPGANRERTWTWTLDSDPVEIQQMIISRGYEPNLV